ncbi:MAG: lipoate--protein ligase family protein [Verrucomicrobia bacterium]|nr:lipoate--protein ligase family protein [Verrucomicrobiota bacterium]
MRHSFQVEFIQLTNGHPAEFLAWDEAFLAETEATGREFLWFWESSTPFVVLGYGQTLAREVLEVPCRERGIPILRRCSGGGAVVQGPGCLNYALSLHLPSHSALASVTSTNQWIMNRQAQSLSSRLKNQVVVRGHTDLALTDSNGERKFSGNAQRRTRDAVLFHGTLLYQFDLPWITTLLAHPTDQPAYRAQRSHQDFVTNLPLTQTELINLLLAEWRPNQPVITLPTEHHQAALRRRYAHPEWHRSRQSVATSADPDPTKPFGINK